MLKKTLLVLVALVLVAGSLVWVKRIDLMLALVKLLSCGES